MARSRPGVAGLRGHPPAVAGAGAAARPVGETGQAAFFLADAWLDGPGGSPPDPARPQDAREQLVMRYLAAYGPASVRDIQAWSGLSKLREDRAPLCCSTRGCSTGAVRGAGQPGPVNPGPGCARSPVPTAASSSTCRTRPRRTPIPRRRPGSCPNTTTCCSPSPTAAGSSRTAVRCRCLGHGGTGGTLLVDGFWQADWKIVSDKTRSVLEVRPFIELSPAERDAIAAEGELLLGFAGPAGTVPATGPSTGSRLRMSVSPRYRDTWRES